MNLKISRELSLPTDVLTEALGIVATRGAGKTYASVVLIEEAHDAGVPFVVIDATSVYHGLRSSADGTKAGLPVYVFGGRHGDLPLEAGAGELMADVVVDTGHSFVLDVSDFTRGVSRRFVSAFLNRLYERKARNRSPLFLVVDEADEWAPQKPNRDSALSLSAMELIVKRGRSRGLGCVLITQRTQALNKDVLDLVETLIAMRQLAERSREAVKGWIADKETRDELGVIDSLPSLPTGQAWVWSPVRQILERVTIRRIRTFDSYGSQTVGGDAPAEPAQRAELDLDALGEQMRQTVQRAKENDVGEFRKRVRELERELASRPTEVETVTETVEVPVLTDEMMERLAETVAPAADALVAVKTFVETFCEATDALANAEIGRQPRAEQVERREVARQAHEPAARPPARRPAPPAPVATNGEVTRAQQKVLDAIAWLSTIGLEGEKNRVGFLAGYSPKSGNFNNLLSKLRSGGYVDYPRAGVVELTHAGAAVANPPDEAPTTGELQSMVYERLPRAQCKVLEQVVRRYPDSIDKESLGEATDYSPSSGNFNNILSRLRSLGLIDYPTPGWVRAEDVLFID